MILSAPNFPQPIRLLARADSDEFPSWHSRGDRVRDAVTHVGEPRMSLSELSGVESAALFGISDHRLSLYAGQRVSGKRARSRAR
jgi:hypothetical protein